MGLDMYLYRNNKITCPHCGEKFPSPELGDEVIYWRKANQINKWFEDHCADGNLENCVDYPVTENNLKELRDTCLEVINHSKLVDKVVKEDHYNSTTKKTEKVDVTRKIIEDPSYAKKLLPTQDGFFYGDTDYNEWYLDDLNRTVVNINKVLKTTNFDECALEYHAWW